MVLSLLCHLSLGYLAVKHGNFVDRHPVTHQVMDSDIFLMGVNLAWVNFRGDFGSMWGSIVPNKTFTTFENTVTQLSQAGGNAIRFWVHCDAANTPEFDADGNVVGTDVEKWSRTSGRLVQDMQRYLAIADQYQVKMLFSLFNFGIQEHALKGGKLLTDDDAFNSYVTKALTPIVQGTKGSNALIGYEIFNEPEGMMGGIVGAGWSKPTVAVHTVLAFINKMAGTIHDLDANALVTVGSWSLKVVTSTGFGNHALYNDSSLISAGGHPKGYLDFYQAHWYEAVGSGMVNPFLHSYGEYGLDKPLIIGEFSQCCSGPLMEAHGGTQEESAVEHSSASSVGANANAEAVPLMASAIAALGSPKSFQVSCTTKGLSSEAMYKHLKSSGFHGGLAWQANDHDGPPNGGGICGDALATMLTGIRGAQGLKRYN